MYKNIKGQIVKKVTLYGRILFLRCSNLAKHFVILSYFKTLVFPDREPLLGSKDTSGGLKDFHKHRFSQHIWIKPLFFTIIAMDFYNTITNSKQSTDNALSLINHLDLLLKMLKPTKLFQICLGGSESNIVEINWPWVKIECNLNKLLGTFTSRRNGISIGVSKSQG